MANIELKSAFKIQTGNTIKQCRAVPVNLGKDAPRAYLAAYSAVFDVDPYGEMFFFPEDTLKFMLFDQEGNILWKKDLGRGVIPGVWFCPVISFDLNGDGVDEIWFVDNKNAEHPLGTLSYTLTGLDARTGEEVVSIPWPHVMECRKMPMSEQFRNFIVGGYVHEKPILVAAQGTYSDMYLEGIGVDMNIVWETMVKAEEPGARGSHMCPVLDYNDDGVDELFWGERCIELAGGQEVFCADRDTYRGHSDIISPVYDEKTHRWKFFTCRETDETSSPRICCYDDQGKRLWGHLDHGHIDLGWVARLGPDRGHYAMGIRIGHKTCGPDGRYHDKYEEFIYNLEDGSPVDLGYSVYKTLPVDLNGDGYHELVRGLPSANGDVLDRKGHVVGNVGGSVALSGKLLDRDGEHLLTYGKDGTIQIWYDANAKDTPEAHLRYQNPFYKKAMSVLGNGYNWCILGGI